MTENLVKIGAFVQITIEKTENWLENSTVFVVLFWSVSVYNKSNIW